MKPVAKCVTPEDTLALVAEVIASGHLTTGSMTARAEKEFAEYLGVEPENVVGTNSGTSAMMSVIASLPNIGTRHKRTVILVPDNTFLATIEAVVWAGYEPILYPVNPTTNRVNRRAFDDLLMYYGEQLQAVMTTDIGGWVSKDFDYFMAECKYRFLFLIQDSAHSAGSNYNCEYSGKVGSHPNPNVITCFSLHPIKTIGGADGGFIVTRSKALTSSLRKFRSHGIEAAESVDYKGVRSTAMGWKYTVNKIGFKTGMSDVQAAFAIPLIADLESRVAKLKSLKSAYASAIESSDILQSKRIQIAELISYENAAAHLLIIDLGGLGNFRDEICQGMFDKGIQVSVHYQPLSSFVAFKDYVCNMAKSTFSSSTYKGLYGRMLSLPIHIDLTPADIHEIVEALANTVGAVHVGTSRPSTCDNDRGIRG